jgi:hypothetical protein
VVALGEVAWSLCGRQVRAANYTWGGAGRCRTCEAIRLFVPNPRQCKVSGLAVRIDS